MSSITLDQSLQMAIGHHQAGRFAEAEALYRQVLALQPQHSAALNMLGILAAGAGHLDSAIDLFQRAIAAAPGEASFYCNLGKALIDAGHVDPAIAAYRQAVALQPDFVVAHNHLAAALNARGLTDEAIASYRHALQLKPDYPEALNNLGYALKDRGELDEALACFRLALRFMPQYRGAHDNLVYALHFHPASTPQTLREEHVRWNQQYAVPLQAQIPPHANDRTPGRRLRIGYVSPDFRDHVVGRFFLPLLAARDKARVEVFCYADVATPDAITGQIRSHADHWRPTTGLSDDQLAGLVRQDRIDILVDLAMHMGGNRLLVFARKPAPVQVTYLAYCSTTGLDAIDYRLSDPYLDPPESDASCYTEETLRLSDTYWCYAPTLALPVNDLPADTAGFVTFGALNNFCKVSDSALATWGRLLQLVPSSRLLLHAQPGSHRQRVLRALSANGVAAERLTFIPFLPVDEYLRQYHAIDVALDTFPYAGGTTTCDALWMGVPVVSLAGRTAVGRGGVSILSNLGLAEFVGHSEEEYLRIAAELAGDAARLRELRATLRSRMQSSPLTDAPRFARAIEAAYHEMWTQWCNS